MAASLDFGGEESFEVDPARLFGELTDLESFRRGIPDLVSAERVDDRTLRAVVKPGFSFLRGTMKLMVTMADLQPSESATLRIDANGIGVSMRIESKLLISAASTGAKLNWQATVSELKGLIATVSPGLITAAAEKIIHDSWRRLRERLKATS